MCGATMGQCGVDSHSRQWKRRSADIGGLHLATGNSGRGQGWVGTEVETRFAELLSDMYNQTLHAVNEYNPDFVPAHLPNEVRSRLINTLDSWHFEPHKLLDDEVLACTLILFEAVLRIEGMEETIGISMRQLSAFVHHLRQIYRYENTYHNFEHALDVLQATHSYLRSAGMVPPVSILLEPGRMWRVKKKFDSGPLITSLGLRDLFVLYVAAIGHDVGHPGFSNVFMKNAQTPLSIVFDGKSALEQMHCQLLLRVMRYHGLGPLLDDAIHGSHFRKLLWNTVLATDMSVHSDFMRRFEEAIDNNEGALYTRQVIICQAILKNADISNPSRPFTVSQHWASAVMQEWSSQAKLEQHYSLQQTVQASSDPLAEAKSQIFFTSMFAKPLLDLTVRAIPELAMYAQQCDSNVESWKLRQIELQSGHIESTVDDMAHELSPPSFTRQPSDYQSAFPLTLPQGPAVVSLSTLSNTSTDSIPASPCGSFSSSIIFSPTSESHVSNDPEPSSSSGMSSNSGTSAVCHPLDFTQDNYAAIRAAGKLSIRQHKKINRNSWCATSTLFNPPPLSSPAHTPPNYPPSALKLPPPPASAPSPNGVQARSPVTFLKPPSRKTSASSCLAPGKDLGETALSKAIKAQASPVVS